MRPVEMVKCVIIYFDFEGRKSTETRITSVFGTRRTCLRTRSITNLEIIGNHWKSLKIIGNGEADKGNRLALKLEKCSALDKMHTSTKNNLTIAWIKIFLHNRTERRFGTAPISLGADHWAG